MSQNGQEPWPFYEVLANMQGITRLRLLTSPFRCLPDFLIIGAMKCGTTSLYRYLIGHPCVATAVKKEVHFSRTTTTTVSAGTGRTSQAGCVATTRC